MGARGHARSVCRATRRGWVWKILVALVCVAMVSTVALLSRWSAWCLVHPAHRAARCEAAAMVVAILEDAGVVTWLCYGSLLAQHRDGRPSTFACKQYCTVRCAPSCGRHSAWLALGSYTCARWPTCTMC